QDADRATYAPILKKEDGRIDWRRPAAEIYNAMRGFDPWPGCYSEFRGRQFHIWKAAAHSVRSLESPAPQPPGALWTHGRRLYAACGADSALELLEVQLEGRKRISAEAFRNGHPISENERLGGTAK
ncbi:MAG: methionyl-tRNA formyltransferase, partial [Bryobacteraceae bacterium]